MHAHNCIDEEEHSHEHTNVRQSFEALHKGVEQNSDTHRPPQKLNESGSSEKLQKTHGDHFGGVYDATNHSYEIKGVPRVFEVVLQRIRHVLGHLNYYFRHELYNAAMVQSFGFSNTLG